MEVKELKKLLKYDRKTGVFTWKPRGNPRFDTRFAGTVAGCEHTSGRGRKSWAIKLNGRKYYAHILAWAYVNGEWPEEEIDHVDHNTLNNRIRNLRHVTNAENKKNLPKRADNCSGVTGVYRCVSANRWVASIVVARKKVYLGQFREKTDAIAARLKANEKYGYHRNHGK
jgi:hypothetical protein